LREEDEALVAVDGDICDLSLAADDALPPRDGEAWFEGVLPMMKEVSVATNEGWDEFG